MTKAMKSEIRLGRLEMQIMNVVWNKGKATVHEVKDKLSRGKKKPAYSTILTMMRKLEAKGYLKHDVNDRTYVYEPTISCSIARQGIIGDLLDRLFEGSPALLLTSLVEQNRISDEEYAEIQKLLKKRKGKK